MLFNKNDNGTEELREHLGFLFRSNEFENMKTEVMLAEEDLTELIGQEVYNKAQEHYDSEKYLNPVTDDEKSLTKLVKNIQLPVAYFAYHSYAPHTDVTHEDTGRKVNLDPDNQKIPFEWLLERDNQGILEKAHKTTDRLIAFLEKNASITDFDNTDAQKEIRSLILKNARALDDVFPIGKSRRFFLVSVTFQKDAMKNHLRPVLGVELYNAIVDSLKNSGTYTDDEALFDLVKVAVGLKTMEIASRRLAVQVLPSAIVQNYISERMTMKSSKNPEREFLNQFRHDIERDASKAFNDISVYLEKKAADANPDDDIEYDPLTQDERMDVDEKFMRL